MSISTFYRLSQTLTGVDDLDHETSLNFAKSFEKYFGATFTDLLTVFQSASQSADGPTAVSTALADVEAFHDIARQIVVAWFTGQFATPVEDIEPPHSVKAYSDSLLWRVIGAHAPGFTNAGYGAWSTMPGVAPSTPPASVPPSADSLAMSVGNRLVRSKKSSNKGKVKK